MIIDGCELHCGPCTRIIENIVNECTAALIRYSCDSNHSCFTLYCGCDRARACVETGIQRMKLMVASFTVGERTICKNPSCVLWARRRSMRLAVKALHHPCNKAFIEASAERRRCVQQTMRRFRATIARPTRLDEQVVRKSVEYYCTHERL